MNITINIEEIEPKEMDDLSMQILEFIMDQGFMPTDHWIDE